MKHWFSQLAPREYRALIIGTVALGIMVGYLMLLEPLVTARLQLENVVAAQKNTWRWMNQAAAEVLQLRQQSSTAPQKQSLLSLIDKSTRSGKLRKAKKRIEPKGTKEVRVRFEAVSFTELMRWLGQLYNQHQVQVSTISVERQQIPDKVKVNLTLKYNQL